MAQVRFSFKIIASFSGGGGVGGSCSPCPLNLCEAADERRSCSSLARELLMPAAPPPAPLAVEVGNVSSHHGHVAQTRRLRPGRADVSGGGTAKLETC